MKNLLLILALGWTATLLAQSAPLQGVRFGLRAGGSYSVMNFNAGVNSGSGTFTNKWKPGFYLGGLLEVPLDETFSLQPEYLYRSMTGLEEQTGADYTLQYLSLPVLVRAAVTPRIAVVAGPEFGLLIHSASSLAGVSYNETHNTEERAISAVGGLEVRVVRGLVADIRYVHGLNHVGLGQRSNTREFKWRGVELGVGWKW